MTTYSTFLPGSGTAGTVGVPGFGSGAYHPQSYARKPYYLDMVIDFSVQNAATGSIFNCFALPIGSLVLAVGGEVLVAADQTTPVCKIGHTDDDDEWVAASTDIQTTGHMAAVGNGTAAPVALQVTAASKYIILTTTSTGTLTLGKVRVWMLILDVSSIHTSAT